MGLNGGRPQPHQERAVHTLSAKDGLPCDAVHWAIEDDTHAFWLYTACGLARVARSDVEAWAVDEERRGRDAQIKATVLDHADGVRVHAMPGNCTPQVGKSRDGRIWFLPWDGVSVLDPGRLRSTPFRLRCTSNRSRLTGRCTPAPELWLPRDVRDVSIDFTALSFVAPEKIRFRYILEGQDPEWKEVVNDRRAHYSNLPPGQYRFRVQRVTTAASGTRRRSCSSRSRRPITKHDGSRRSAPQRLWGCSGPRTGCTSGTWCGS